MKTSNAKPTVMVTGSTGLFGARICQRLVERYSIVGLDIKEPDEPIEVVEWIECDFTDDESVASALDRTRERLGSKFASVIHLAAYYDFAGEPSPLYNDLTVEGTRRLLHGLRRFDAVEQFIFSSSLLVMKPCRPGELLDESSPTQAEWDYPQSKLDAEHVIRSERDSIPALILRLAGVTPPLQPVLQNEIIVGLLLMMFAIVPNEASLPPRMWRE